MRPRHCRETYALCMFVLFQAYAKKLTRSVDVREDMELVAQPDDHEAHCHCHTHPQKVSNSCLAG